jgi:hypothetical protein
MKKITFDFLKTMEIKEVEKTPLSSPTSKIPGANAHLRLFADGSLYPSKELVQLHNLEFQPQESANAENGYDVFTSTEWEQYGNSAANAVPFVCLALVSKHEARVSLFSQTKYNADKTPKSSVLTQKTNAGQELIDALSKVYLEKPEDNLFEGKPYLDLVIGLTTPLTKSATGVYHIPKVIAKGKDAGKPTYVRRENIQIFPVMIVEDIAIITVAATKVVTAPAITVAPAQSAANAMFGI